MTPSSTDYRLIPLTQGQFAIVDTADYEWLMQWKWCVQWAKNTKSFYAIRVSIVNGERATIRMHRLILNLHRGDNRMGDHINHETLDNRRGNLRVATVLENNRNVRKRCVNTSGHVGVSWHKNSKKWRAYIMLPSGQKSLGYYEEIEDAATAYSDAAKEHFGEFSQTTKMVASAEAIDTVRELMP